jgi:hypothetical protein
MSAAVSACRISGGSGAIGLEGPWIYAAAGIEIKTGPAVESRAGSSSLWIASRLHHSRWCRLRPDGLLYALELQDAAGFPAPPFVGKVVRLNRVGDIEEVATGLSLPTDMTFGPDGYLYVSNFGATPSGQILRISVH